MTSIVCVLSNATNTKAITFNRHLKSTRGTVIGPVITGLCDAAISSSSRVLNSIGYSFAKSKVFHLYTVSN